MNKETLLSQAKQHNIPLTESKIRRYVNLGIVISKRTGKGRGMGVTAEYHDDSIEVIKEVARIQGVKQENLIYCLFWKGYPVDYEKLRDSLFKYVTGIVNVFTLTARLTDDPRNIDIIDGVLEEVAVEAMPVKKPGRPTRESDTEMRLRYKQELKSAQATLDFVSNLGKNKVVTPESLISFVNVYYPAIATDLDSLGDIIEWTNLDKLRSSVLQSGENDYYEIQEIIGCLKEYWAMFTQAVGETSLIPFFKEFMDKLDYLYPGGVVATNTSLIKYALLVFLTVNKLDETVAYLKSEDVKQAFHTFCNQLATLKGGESQ